MTKTTVRPGDPDCGDDCECWKDSSAHTDTEAQHFHDSLHPDREIGDAQACPNPLGSPVKRLSWLDRFLTLWILLAMAVGIILGYFVPSTHRVLETVQFVNVSLPIALGLLVMMYPILCKVRYEHMHVVLRSKALWKQIAFSFVLNWIVAPLIMVALAWATLPDERGYREGLILVGLARCIAMVLIWTDLANGDGEYCAILVAFNSLLQIVLFSPFALFYLNVVAPQSDSYQAGNQGTVSYSVVAKSVAVFLGIPLGAAVITRFAFLKLGGKKFFHDVFIPLISPLSLIGLLFTILILFASQGRQVVQSITGVLRVCAPLILYFLLLFFGTLYLARYLGYTYRICVVQAFTGASNNFELAIAVAIASYGIDSKQALASVVGPLVEVPVLLGLTHFVTWRHQKGDWRRNGE
ncbi:arsenical-resistance protein ACR3 [Saitoella complicata NRRL Y-17804]|nr:arsenical-resistance protein ACR3 [Saitoella complicata NRRL Y-17804]ODQ55232.1 arsenical-resistance protein ACR3 [Saitoella complicata NRRL Y-17804]